MELNTFFYLAVILLSGLICGRLVKFIKLPNVTGYLIAGLLIGPHILRIVPETTVDQLGLLSEMALGFIAFSIGGEFKISYFKRVGVTPIVIAITEALGAVLLVTLGLIFTGNGVPFSLVLGSIAAATAPAATIMVVKQYKAKGPVTETLMSVVALDDAVALISFGFAVTIAKTLTHSAGGSLAMSILQPFIEIGLALGIGGILGIVMTIPLRWFKKDSNRLIIICGFIFLSLALAAMLNVSSLMMCMAMAAVFANVYRSSDEIAKIADYVTPPIFVIFFVVSGAGLDITVLPTIGIVGVVYLLLRVVGKIAGAWFGAAVMKADDKVKKYLGPTLIPQAGVAIGLTLVAQTVVPEHAAAIRAVVLCATMIYEIVGPAITKVSLQKAGEIAKGV